MMLSLLDESVATGARLERACEVVNLSIRTVQRWRTEQGGEDKRCGPKGPLPQELTHEERKAVLAVANSAEFRDKSPRQIVPTLADRGEYIASEATFYRVLHAENMMGHRAPSRPRRSTKPDEHIATAPNQVWCWDITYLRSPVRGVFYYLYLMLDIYSRKIVGYTVAREECMSVSSELIEKTTCEENIRRGTLVLHADNGGPMKGGTMLSTLTRLGVLASFSRPRVSDDNPYAEALFRTLKYKPGYPRQPFESLDAARAWVDGFVDWYNCRHLHSGIRYVTPNERHAGRDPEILAKRHDVYLAARDRTPSRWSRHTRNWTPIQAVALNPVTSEIRAAS